MNDLRVEPQTGDPTLEYVGRPVARKRLRASSVHVVVDVVVPTVVRHLYMRSEATQVLDVLVCQGVVVKMLLLLSVHVIFHMVMVSSSRQESGPIRK